MITTDISRIQLPGGTTVAVYQAYEKSKIRLLLETAGPVGYGTAQSSLVPTGTNGDLLVFDLWTDFILKPGQILYMASDSPQTIGFIKQAVDYPDLELQLSQLQQSIYVLINTAQGQSGKGGAKPSGC